MARFSIENHLHNSDSHLARVLLLPLLLGRRVGRQRVLVKRYHRCLPAAGEVRVPLEDGRPLHKLSLVHLGEAITPNLFFYLKVSFIFYLDGKLLNLIIDMYHLCRSFYLRMKVHVAVVDQRLEDGPVAIDVDALLGGSVGRFSLWQPREESLGGGGPVKG